MMHRLSDTVTTHIRL